MTEETLEHLFYDCNITYNFWLTFQQNIRNFDDNFTFSKEQILLGFTEKNLFFNLIFIIGKTFLYKCKLKETTPTFIGFKSKIKQYQSFELLIANKNNITRKYEQFWAPSQSIFQE